MGGAGKSFLFVLLPALDIAYWGFDSWSWDSQLEPTKKALPTSEDALAETREWLTSSWDSVDTCQPQNHLSADFLIREMTSVFSALNTLPLAFY